MVRGETFTMRLTAFVNGGDIDDLSDRIDLTGSVAHWRQKLNAVDSAVEIAKSSALATEILLLPQGVGVATRGQFDVFLIPFDTANTPLPVGTHVFDSWIVHPTLGDHAVVRLGTMVLLREITNLAVVIPPPTPGTPFPQSSQARTFLHTWSATGTSDTVTIPGGATAMFDATYVVKGDIEDIPVGGSFAGIWFPSAGRTQSSFTVQAQGPLLIGTTIGFKVTDRA
ncbi:hypothetical protein LCGC14_1447760 [marine sediment metagenome]|uniref:Uncharacterized protein n=1 Tax=marine sediment metagenome TaxID=412755 RepID=A0A0F9LZ63_9ZZZZ